MGQTATTILPGEDAASIERAAEVLRAGGLVGMPTETVYGLAANALDETAIAKVYQAKQRPSFDPLIVHVPSIDKAAQLAEFDATATRLAEAFWPGPMTLVLPRCADDQGRPVVPDLVTSGLDSVAVRVPGHPVALALLLAVDRPLAAPSANRFGSISPTLAQHVVDELDGRVDLVLDGGPCYRGVESTVLRVKDGGVQVLRLGALALEQIEEVVGGAVRVLEPSSSPGMAQAGEALPSPGLTKRHYAPGTPMNLFASAAELSGAEHVGQRGLIYVGSEPGVDPSRYAQVRCLSQLGDLTQAAACLFVTLRELDGLGLDGIDALAVAEQGLGRAINDRLRRGSAR